MNKTFKQGDKLATSSICNSDCIFEAEVIKRTRCTVTIEMYGRETKRCNVQHDDDGNEMIYPHGVYSMCTIYRANRDVVKVKPVFSEYAKSECSAIDTY